MNFGIGGQGHTLCSGITSGGTQIFICNDKDQSWLSHMQGKRLTHCTIVQLSQHFFIL